MSDDKKIKRLDEDGKAVSPFEKWPGHVKFPDVITLPHYRLFLAHRDSQAEANEDADVIQRLVRLEPAEGDEPAQAISVKFSDLALAQQLAEEVKIENGDPFAENAPLQLVFWVIECLEEWLNSRLSFRTHSVSSMAE